MAKSEKQKLKLLYLLDLLRERSDENHPVSTQDMISHLEKVGIRAERKSIYDDIVCLQEYGADIEQRKGRGGGYYLASRDFELPEIKLLVDAVQSSKFLTHKKSLDLIAKLEKLALQFLRFYDMMCFSGKRIKNDMFCHGYRIFKERIYEPIGRTGRV